ncbi:unnamed protein product [Phytophthora lilii]|uniref:Unnamed protein product n=1 Tax=Phytophthora lilii TaxID=2077276 RepID=A0A9W7D9U8_9STRA|nr:unnamed protein product [Phytophthora lilii]
MQQPCDCPDASTGLDGLDLRRGGLVAGAHGRVHGAAAAAAVHVLGRRRVAHELGPIGVRALDGHVRDEQLHAEGQRAEHDDAPAPGIEVLPLAHQDEQHDGRDGLQQQHEAVAEVVLQHGISRVR